jgi:hypothetical protein
MDVSRLPKEWQDAFGRDLIEKPALPDPIPERRLARLLGAFIVTGLFYMVLPGTVLGVWNLVGISSQQEMTAVSTAWIQAHGHAQFFGWVGTFILGISLYAFPKFRGSLCRSVPVGWMMWLGWSTGVGLRWVAGIQSAVHRWEFVAASTLEVVVSLVLLWQVTPTGPKHKKGQAWELPVFAGLGALPLVLGWQLLLSLGPLTSPALPAPSDRILISLAIWMFSFLVVVGYSAKFFPGLLGTAPANVHGIRVVTGLAALAAAGFMTDKPAVAAAASVSMVLLSIWSLRIFGRQSGAPKTSGVYERYPQFARLAYIWLAVSAGLGFGVSRPGVLGASRHAFTVGFLATLIFSIGPRILPSFLNSRELWSPKLMRASLLLITAGCLIRVISEPLAYGGIVAAAWKVLPASALAELTAVLLFALNLAMSLATPIPSWFGRKHVNDRMSVYWLVSSYPATRKILIECGLRTLEHVETVPKTLSLREAAHADRVEPAILVETLGGFFESRLPRSLRQPLRTSESRRSTNR